MSIQLLSNTKQVLCQAMATREKRGDKVFRITELIYKNCIQPDPDRIKQTGTLLPTPSLRHKRTRECLSFARDIEGRIFTQALVRDCLRALLANPVKYSLELPCTPGFSSERWIQDESKVLHKLLKRARKSTTAETLAAMDKLIDEMETQPWDINSFELDPNEDDLRGSHTVFCATVLYICLPYLRPWISRTRRWL